MRRRWAFRHCLNLINGRSDVAVENNSSRHSFLGMGQKLCSDAKETVSSRCEFLSDPL